MREHKKPHAKTLFKFAGWQVMCHFHGVRTLNFIPGMWIAKLLMSLPPSVVSRIFLIINLQGLILYILVQLYPWIKFYLNQG